MRRSYIAAILSLALLAPVAAAASDADLWLHVRVTERDAAKVVVNLPFSLIGKALPMIDVGGHIHDDSIHINGHRLSYQEMRDLWREVRNGPDMEIVTVEDRDESVRIWKEDGRVHVRVRDQRGRGERVDLRMPIHVVDAFMGGERDFDVEAAVRALAASGEGELIAVEDGDESVRVWVDHEPESDGRGR